MELKFMTEPPLNPALYSCPHCGETEHIWIHSQKEGRLRCGQCGRTFVERQGTPLFGSHYANWVIILVVTLLAYGCPITATVMAFGIDERTVMGWQAKVGQHARVVQKQIVCAGQVELGQVQGDELCVKTQYGRVWIATAMSVFARLFIWGEVGVERNRGLIERVVHKVRAAAVSGQPILWVTDGFAAWPTAICKVFRTPHYTGKLGRPRLVVWADLHIAQVIKRFTSQHLAPIERRLIHGSLSAAQAILQASQCDWGLFNTAYIERLNATFRTWLPALSRRSRTPARHRPQLEAALFWTGCTYNFCHVHASLSATPAMAAGLTDHVWSVRQLLFCLRFRRQELHAIL